MGPTHSLTQRLRAMIGKTGEIGGNEEKLRGFYSPRSLNKLAAISTNSEMQPDLITNQLLYQLS
jgi:hypothetical protein